MFHDLHSNNTPFDRGWGAYIHMICVGTAVVQSLCSILA